MVGDAEHRVPAPTAGVVALSHPIRVNGEVESQRLRWRGAGVKPLNAYEPDEKRGAQPWMRRLEQTLSPRELKRSQ